MRTARILWGVVLVLATGCATGGPGERKLWREIYWDAARTCESRFGTLRINQVKMDGEVSLVAAAESRSELQAYRECYWRGIRERADRLRGQGEVIPDGFTLEPEVDIE